MSREIIRKYRLSPTELNALSRKLASTYNSDLSPLEFNKQSVVYAHGRKFIIFPMCKDAENETNEAGLPFIGDALQNFSKNNSDQDCTLLIPMRMCRGYLKAPTFISYLKRKHAVLVEINLIDKHIEVHDSQGQFRRIFYPDKLIEVASNLGFNYEPAKHYHAHGVQENLFFSDVVSCGYYVFAYLSHILETGNALGCEKIMLNISDENADKSEFLKRHGVEFSGLDSFDDDGDEDFLEFEVHDQENKELVTFEIGPENELHIDLENSENTKSMEKKDSLFLGQGLFSNISINENKIKKTEETTEVKFKV